MSKYVHSLRTGDVLWTPKHGLSTITHVATIEEPLGDMWLYQFFVQHQSGTQEPTKVYYGDDILPVAAPIDSATQEKNEH